MVHSNLGGIYVPPLNRKVEYDTMPTFNQNYNDDNFEERIRKNVISLREKGLLPPWYYPIIEILTGKDFSALPDNRTIEEKLDFEERIRKKARI